MEKLIKCYQLKIFIEKYQFFIHATSYTVIAKRIKGQLAENSKMLSYFGELPEA